MTTPDTTLPNSLRDYLGFAQFNEMSPDDRDTYEAYIAQLDQMPDHYDELQRSLCRTAALSYVRGYNPPTLDNTPTFPEHLMPQPIHDGPVERACVDDCDCNCDDYYDCDDEADNEDDDEADDDEAQPEDPPQDDVPDPVATDELNRRSRYVVEAFQGFCESFGHDPNTSESYDKFVKAILDRPVPADEPPADPIPRKTLTSLHEDLLDIKRMAPCTILTSFSPDTETPPSQIIGALMKQLDLDIARVIRNEQEDTKHNTDRHSSALLLMMRLKRRCRDLLSEASS